MTAEVLWSEKAAAERQAVVVFALRGMRGAWGWGGGGGALRR